MAAATENVIRHLNPILRGWTNNYRHVVSKQVFEYVSQQIWKMFWKWCLRRHSKKGKRWVATKYFGHVERARWTFQAKSGDTTLYLFDVRTVPIERHIKVKGTASPDDPNLQEYWTIRKDERKTRRRQRQSNKSPAFIRVGGVS
jgi:RNA-directed DNA polymerase